MHIDNITSIRSLITNKRVVNTHILSCSFFILLAVTSPEIFHKHKGYFFILEYFAFN